MNNLYSYAPLTISLLARLSDHELQSNYLNQVDRTPEIAGLLSQIEDKDLALKIINLALEVDLILGSQLTCSAPPEIQSIIVEKIDRLEIPVALKIELWRKTESKFALPHLQNIFFLKLHYQDARYQLTESSISAIIDIDPEQAIILLRESQYDSRFCDKAAVLMAKIAPDEAIEPLARSLHSPCFINDYDGKHLAMQALHEISTDAAINKIREFLNDKRHYWSDRVYIQGLGIVAEPAMIDHLLYLLSQPEDTEDLAYEAIEALECLGEKMFDCLHRALYWLKFEEDRSYIIGKILEILLKWDQELTMQSLEGAIQSHDPIVKTRAALALSSSCILNTDQSLSILLGALDSSEMEVQLEIAGCIRHIILGLHSLRQRQEPVDISSELIEQAILATKPILINNAHHPNPVVKRQVIHWLFDSEPDEQELIIDILDSGISWTYLKDDTVETRAVAKIAQSGDASAPPILLQLLDDPDLKIRKAAVAGIIELGIKEILPALLKIAVNHELVTTLVSSLDQLAHCNPHANIFGMFHSDQDFTMKFLVLAEKTMVENVQNTRTSIFDLGKIGDELAITALKEILIDNNNYDNVDDAVHSIAQIGTDLAVSTLLSFLSEMNIMTGWINTHLSNRGRLGIVPQLWSCQQQIYSFRSAYIIARIQQREGLYNPAFSDFSAPCLFFQDSARLRDFLLNNYQQH
jgi:HEAT repeat protein